MGLLDGKKIVITGVLTDASLAFGVARSRSDEGAEIVLTGAGRALSLTQRTARKLGDGDRRVRARRHRPRPRRGRSRRSWPTKWGRVDGVLHSIGFAPEAASATTSWRRTWDDVAVAMHISAYSLKALADAFVPLMTRTAARSSGSTSTTASAWPAYNWMGVAKSALQSVNRYLAKELGPQGIRSNLVAAGPVRTMAAKSIPGFALFEDTWDGRAPLGWDVNDSEPVAKACVALLSRLVPRDHRRDHPRRRRLPRRRAPDSANASLGYGRSWVVAS